MEPFGSFVSELFTRWGDLDVSIEFSKGAYISSYGKKHSLDVLKDVRKALKGRGRFVDYYSKCFKLGEKFSTSNV